MSRKYEDMREHRARAVTVLNRVKESRKGLKIRYERIDEHTWVERSEGTESLKQPHMMQSTVTRQDAEQAIALYRTAKSAKAEYEAVMADAERIINQFGRANLDQFSEGRLELDSGTLALKSGAAKPLKGGRPLTTAARAELAALLPEAYVRLSCDFTELYGCRDKMVRQLLAVRGIEIVRDDKFVVL
ncbi:hypothetical protein [uncultured Rikenella sp.]|uniref:hypothetical protein n=1 Tax=uncultured Rikenella sp. TaxID=368003 RepID=UPI002604AED7|nr:hypothetical protein [uncultured Rikenella sp.]